MSQQKLGDELGITFQQIQKYEKGANRISSSRMQQIADVLKVTPTFFFEGLPPHSQSQGKVPMPEYISQMLSTREGIALVKAFTTIESVKLKRAIIHLVEEMGAGNADAE